jgi:ligand-binding sensor domain-containing protein
MRRLVLLCGLLVLLSAPRVWAVDPTRQISQYGHTVWRIQDGSFNAAPIVITQTRDGYLWIGTDNGLLRFDGVRFVSWTPPAGKQLPSPLVYALLGARDGSLWIGTSAGLSHLVGQDLVNYPEGGQFAGLLEDRDGTVWAVRSGSWTSPTGPLCQIVDAAMHCFGKAEGPPVGAASSLADDRRGGLWIGGNSALVHGKPGSFTAYKPPGLTVTRGLGYISGLAVAAEDSVWAGVDNIGVGLQQFAHGVWAPFTTPELDGRTLWSTSSWSIAPGRCGSRRMTACTASVAPRSIASDASTAYRATPSSACSRTVTAICGSRPGKGSIVSVTCGCPPLPLAKACPTAR